MIGFLKNLVTVLQQSDILLKELQKTLVEMNKTVEQVKQFGDMLEAFQKEPKVSKEE